MNEQDAGSRTAASQRQGPTNRLGSWKEIAGYLDAGVRSVQRWEATEGLPIHRHGHDKRSTVYAYKTELDVWRLGRRDLVDAGGDDLTDEGADTDTVIEGKRQVGLRVWTMLAWVAAAFSFAGAGLLIYNYPFQRDQGSLNLSVALPEGHSFEFGPETGGGSISPDGQWLVFALSDGRRSQLWARRLNAPALIPVPGTDRACQPFWSPDSRTIAFFADGKLKTVGVDGGLPKTLCNVEFGRGGAWSRGGLILFQRSRGGTLYGVPDRGGEPRQVTHPDRSKGEYAHMWPSFLPDGHHFLYSIRSSRQDRSGVYLGNITKPNFVSEPLLKGTSQAVFVPARRGASAYLVFLRDGKLLAQPFSEGGRQMSQSPREIVRGVSFDAHIRLADFSVSQTGLLLYGTGHTSLVHPTFVARDGAGVRTVGRPDLWFSPSLASNDLRLALARTDATLGTSTLWTVDLERDAISSLVTGDGRYAHPVWSPDARAIVFLSGRGGPFELSTKNVSEAADEVRMLPPGPSRVPTDYSPDGKYILYTENNPQTGFDLWTLALEGDRSTRPLLHSTADELEGQFSPGMRWFAYTSNRSGQDEVYIRRWNLTGSREWQVSRDGGSQPRWRGDEKELYYRSIGGAIMAVTKQDSGTEPLLSQPETLFSGPTTGQFRGIPTYDVTRDGKSFLVLRPVGGGKLAAHVIANWDSALR